MKRRPSLGRGPHYPAEAQAGDRIIEDLRAALTAEQQAHRITDAETGRLQGELDRYKALYHSVNVMMAVLGMHGTIYARDDRSMAVMDALHAIDNGLPLDDPTALNARRYLYLRHRNLDTIKMGGVFAGLTPDNLVLNEEDLDKAVDRGLAEEGGL